MKRLQTILTACTMFFCTIPSFHIRTAAAPITGKCGDNITYTVENGTLTLTGTGSTYDYSYEPEFDDFERRVRESKNPEEEIVLPINPAPWSAYVPEDAYDSFFETVIVGEGITRLGNCLCYQQGVQTVQLPDSLLEIGDCAFQECYLSAVQLPQNIRSLGDYAFFLNPINTTVSIPASVSRIGDSCFSGSHLPEISFAESETELSIGPLAFSSCPLTSLQIPANVVSLGEGAFRGSDLKEVSFALRDDALQLPSRLFENCESLQKVTLPEQCSALPDRCFIGNIFLTEICVPESCESIGDYCFADCSSLQKVTLPDGLKTIGDEAFSECISLEKIRLPESLESIGYMCFSHSGLTEVEIPPLVTELPYACFGRTSIETLTVPDNVTSIDRYCFVLNSSLKSVVLPDTDIRLEQGCFGDCTALTSVHLPAKCTQLPAQMFAGCSALREIVIPDGCKSIGLKCFNKCSALESVSLPDTVEIIEQKAFSECGKLKELRFPKNLTTIEREAFSGAALREIELPESIRLISYGAFRNCSTDSLKLPDHYVAIEEYALPESWVKKQGDFAVVADGQLYKYCGSDTDVQVPEGVKVILPGAFTPDSGGSSSPETVSLSSTVQTVQTNAFRGCPNLKTLEIPCTVSMIENYAVRNCTKLTAIRGEYYSQAHGLAMRLNAEFVPLHPDETGTAVYPQNDTENFAFGNSGETFGNGYVLSRWNAALLCDNAGAVPYMQNKIKESWNGSCFGLSTVTILVKNGLLPLSALDPEARTLHDVRPTEQALNIINYYQFSQYLKDDAASESNSQFSYLLRAAESAKKVNSGASPFILNIKTKSGNGHAVVGYGLEAGEWEYNGKAYDRRILVWDSNHSASFSDKHCLYFVSDTLEWYIPAYEIGYSSDSQNNSGGISNVISDAAYLNRFPCGSTMLPGDVDRNEKLTAADAVLLAKYIAEETALSFTGNCNADADENDIITIADVFAILRKITA